MSSSNNCGPPEARGSDDDLQGLEILLVEDSQSVADALKQHLELLGAQVAGPAATTAEATKLMAERLPHVALVDFHLRGGDSSGLIAQLATTACLSSCFPALSSFLRQFRRRG